MVILDGDRDDAESGRQRPDEVFEAVAIEERGRSFSIDHHRVARIGRALDLDNAAVMQHRRNLKPRTAVAQNRELILSAWDD